MLYQLGTKLNTKLSSKKNIYKKTIKKEKGEVVSKWRVREGRWVLGERGCHSWVTQNTQGTKWVCLCSMVCIAMWKWFYIIFKTGGCGGHMGGV